MKMRSRPLQQELAGLYMRTNRYAANHRRALVAYTYTILDNAPIPYMIHVHQNQAKFVGAKLRLFSVGVLSRMHQPRRDPLAVLSYWACSILYLILNSGNYTD